MVWMEPPYDSPAGALGQLEERREFLTVQRPPISGTAKGLRGRAGCRWLAATSSLGHLGPRPSRETPRLRPASGLCEGAGGGAVAAGWLPSCHPGPVCLQPERCCRMAGHHARPGRGDSPSPPTQLSWEGSFRHCRLPRSQGRFRPWLCCLSSRVFPSSGCDPGMRGLVPGCGARQRAGSPSGQAVWSQAQSSSPSPGRYPSQAIFAGGSPAVLCAAQCQPAQ